MSSLTILPSLLSTQINSETSQLFAGLQARFRDFSAQGFDFPDEVMDDLDGEQETLALPTESDATDGDVEGERWLEQSDTIVEENVAPVGSIQVPLSSASTSIPTAMDTSGLRSVLKEASKGVSDGMDADYKRYECFHALYIISNKPSCCTDS